MLFTYMTYPNMKVATPKGVVAFKDGTLETTDNVVIKALKEAGFEGKTVRKKPEKPEKPEVSQDVDEGKEETEE